MPGMIFEIFNKDGVVLRRGAIEEGSLNIDIQEDDYRYVIRDEMDPSIIYKQGYMQKVVSKAEANPYSISIVSMDGQDVELYCNTFKDGHTILCYQKSEDPSSKQEIELEGPRTRLKIDPGKYIFYTRNEAETSAVVQFSIIDETREELLAQVKHNIAQYGEKHDLILSGIQGHLEEDESCSVYAAAQRVYLEVPKEDKELLIASYDFLFHAERILNERKQLNNEHAISFTKLTTAPQEFVQVGPEVTRVLVYEADNDKYLFTHSISTDSNKAHMVSLRIDHPHRLELYAGNNLVSCFDVFCPDSAIKASMWNSIKEAIDKTEEVSERRFLLFNNQTDLTEEDKERLSVESYRKPFYEIVSAPEASFVESDIEIYIQEYEMLRRLDKPLYLSVKEDGFVFYPNYSKRFLITDSTMSLNQIKDGLYPEKSYFIWVEDEEHNPLTSMRLISSNYEEMYNYGVSSRLASIRAYQERLVGFVSQQFDNAPKLLREEIDQLSTVADISPNNLYKALIAKLSLSKDTRMFNSIANLILQDKYSSFTVNERFFGGNAVLDRKAGVLTFPERFFEYIIQVDSFSVGDQQMATSYYNIKDTGMVKLENADYFIVSAIDKSNYSRSGFLFLNTFKIDTILSSWKLGIEVK